MKHSRVRSEERGGERQRKEQNMFGPTSTVGREKSSIKIYQVIKKKSTLV